MPMVVENQVLFTGKQIVDAIKFHLDDEGWFKPVPREVDEWLTKQLPESKRVSFEISKWRQSQSGTARLLWLLVGSGIDPFGLCRFVHGDTSTQVMHRRFVSIMDTWAESRA